MSFSYRIRRKLIRGVALGFAVAVVAAPSALAMGPGPMYHGAGLSGSSAYGALHQFPNAGLGVQTSIGVGLGPQTHLHPRAGIVTGNLPAFSVDNPRSCLLYTSPSPRDS